MAIILPDLLGEIGDPRAYLLSGDEDPRIFQSAPTDFGQRQQIRPISRNRVSAQKERRSRLAMIFRLTTRRTTLTAARMAISAAISPSEAP
ncbi:MAG: hypothetical protein DDT26_02660 [Dehalococcoidia bacterium]|nr:hypothetical protein [Chloroflexota bacterium]